MPKPPKPTYRGMMMQAVALLQGNSFTEEELRQRATDHAMEHDVQVGPRAERYQKAAINALLKRKLLCLEDGRLHATAMAEELIVNAELILRDIMFTSNYEKLAAWAAYYNENTKPVNKRRPSALAKERDHFRDEVENLTRVINVLREQVEIPKRPDVAEVGVQCTRSFEGSSKIHANVGMGKETDPRQETSGRSPSPSVMSQVLSPVSATGDNVFSGNCNTWSNLPSTPIRRPTSVTCYPTPESIPRRLQLSHRHESASTSRPPSPDTSADGNVGMDVDDVCTPRSILDNVIQIQPCTDKADSPSLFHGVKHKVVGIKRLFREYVALGESSAAAAEGILSGAQSLDDDFSALEEERAATQGRIAELSSSVQELEALLSTERSSQTRLQRRLEETVNDLEEQKARVRDLEAEIAAKDNATQSFLQHVQVFLPYAQTFLSQNGVQSAGQN